MNKALILVVEDDRPIRNLIVTTLKTHDYKYLTAENGASAIMEASSHNPDIVLLDLGLPDMEGVEVIKKIRTWSNLPIIVVSARSEDTDKIEALDAGADDYVVKPFNIDVLLVRIYNLLLQREKLKSMYGKNFSLQSMGIETTSADDKFMQKLFEIIQDHLDNPDLKVDMICDEMGFSRSNFYRKLKAVTDLSLNDLIRHKRLEVAAQLLKKADMNVTEVSIATGFSTLAYFTKCFKSAYGVSPTEYVKGQPEE